MVGYTEWVCCGTLVNLWYVVTAGHISVVRLGEWNVLDDKYGRPATPGLPDIQVQSCYASAISLRIIPGTTKIVHFIVST